VIFFPITRETKLHTILYKTRHKTVLFPSTFTFFYKGAHSHPDSQKVTASQATNSGTKQMGRHNRSDNGRGAGVALWTHPTHTQRWTKDWQGVHTWINWRTEHTEPFGLVDALLGRHGALNQRQCNHLRYHNVVAKGRTQD
jgi:hypothetical protein